MRRGADYLASLRDGRAVFLDGERVDDVTKHPAFAESVRRIAERYDAAGEALDVTTCGDPARGERLGATWLFPRAGSTQVVSPSGSPAPSCPSALRRLGRAPVSSP